MNKETEKNVEGAKFKGEKKSIAVLFAYDGQQYDGLERIKNMETKSVEQMLFKAFPKDTVTMTHISRASLTAPGDHASKQVISLSYGGSTIPDVEQVSKGLPDDIAVFKIHEVDKGFSARRTCEARTVEYLIPTYAFAAPPEATEYCNRPEDEDDQTYENISTDMPRGGLFETKRRKKDKSLDRRHTFGRISQENGELVAENFNSTSAVPAPMPQTFKKKGWALFWDNFKAMFKPKRKGSEMLKKSLDVTMTRRPSGIEGHEEEKEEPFTSTLRRSLSQKRRTVQEVLDQDIKEREEEVKDKHGFQPLDIPAPTEKQLEEIKSYRMSEKKYATLVSTLALFNGTHNFHNYIPGSVQDDSRCFVHIYNIDASPLEVHNGMEWLRIKVQANAFARDQIRRMMGMLVLVTRTNTPRSVLGNSFGFSKIDIPETPEGFQILDEPHYNNYNADCANAGKPTIRFGDIDDKIQMFRRKIHSGIFDREAADMKFEKWLRNIDNFSFMYCHFLNERGVITKPVNYPRIPTSTSDQVDPKVNVDVVATAAEE